MVTGRYRVRAGQEAKFVAQMELLEDLLRREGRGLRYWALARSTSEPGVFNSVAVWETQEHERRMAEHPLRQALLPSVQRLLVEPPTGTRTLQRLEGCGLVERRRDPGDARSFRVHLTRKGRALEEPVAECWGRVEAQAFGGMSEEEKVLLRGLLARIRKNLGAV